MKKFLPAALVTIFWQFLSAFQRRHTPIIRPPMVASQHSSTLITSDADSHERFGKR